MKNPFTGDANIVSHKNLANPFFTTAKLDRSYLRTTVLRFTAILGGKSTHMTRRLIKIRTFR